MHHLIELLWYQLGEALQVMRLHVTTNGNKYDEDFGSLNAIWDLFSPNLLCKNCKNVKNITLP